MYTELEMMPKQSLFPEHLRGLEKNDFTVVEEEISFNPENVDIVNEKEIDLFGGNMNEMGNSIDLFLADVGTNDEELLSELRQTLVRAIKGMLRDFKAESAMVMLRVKLPTTDFEIPRWHRDSSFFTRTNGKKIFKKVFTPKGASTRFATINSEAALDLEKVDQANFNKLREGLTSPEDFDQENLRIRKAVIDFVDELLPLTPGDSMIYEIGGHEMIMHSEPDIKEPRIFMSVVVGSVEEIEEARLNS